MRIEKKQLSATQTMIYFPNPLPINGTFFASKKKSEITLLENIIRQTNVDTLLLTADFLYINSKQPEDLSDATILATAEIEDYFLEVSSPLFAPSTDTEEKALIILDVIVAPFLRRDGGDIKFENFTTENILQVKFLGKCHGCPYAQNTLKERVEKNIVHYIPEIKKVTLL